MTDPIITVYNQIAALLQAEPTFYSNDGSNTSIIRQRNFILYSGTTRYIEKLKKADADFPEAVLDQGAFSDTAYAKWPTFGTPTSEAPQKEQFTQIYTLTLTTADQRLEPINLICRAACLALRKGGPRLKLGRMIQSWGPIAAAPPIKRADPPAGDSLRRIQVISIPVNFLFDGVDLLS